MYHYVINVACNGLHYFRVELDACIPSDATDIARDLRKRFAECEVSMTRRNLSETEINF